MKSTALPLLLALVLAACAGTPSPDTAPAPDTAPDTPPDTPPDTAPDTPSDTPPDTASPPPPLFRQGCPTPGRATAFAITDPDLHMEGPNAIGGAGDVLLMNARAAFIIQGFDRIRTWYYYGGIPIDAVALEGCAQAGPERFDHLAIGIGAARTGDLPRSVLRGFHGTAAEIISGGSEGGEARVRIHGEDDLFWLVEYELLAANLAAGKLKPRSGPLGITPFVDYVLEPGSRVLRIEVHLLNAEAKTRPIMAGLALFFGHTTRVEHYRDGFLEIGGFGLDVGIPWVVSSATDGAWAVGAAEGSIATLRVSGVDILLDVNPFFAPLTLAPAGQEGDEVVRTFFLAVGGGDANTAVRQLWEPNPDAIGGKAYTLTPFAGTATIGPEGPPAAGAWIRLQRKGSDGSWRTLESLRSGPDGSFGGKIADLGEPYRLVAELEGHRGPAPEEIDLSSAANATVVFEPSGRLRFSATDVTGQPMPARLGLWQSGSLHRWLFYGGGDPTEVPFPPGTYGWTFSRGFEYGIARGSVEVKAGEIAEITASLERVLDTSGFLSTDTHMHADPSIDAPISIRDRLVTVAAEGVEVPVATDHERVVGWAAAMEGTDLGLWLAPVIGEEVTATLPEHTNMYPVQPLSGAEWPQGGFLRWYGMGFGEIFAAERARGAGIRQLNHPRDGCNVLCLIGWDRITGAPGVTDPAVLGLDPGMSIWSWDFEAVELMNGHQRIFANPERPERTGIFEDWMSFLNHGHRITAVGVTDSHGTTVGSPRTYFASPTDDPTDFEEQDLVDAIAGGRALISTGAFLRVKANDTAAMGDTLTDTDGLVDLQIRVEALPEVDVGWVQVFVNCDEVAKIPTTHPGGLIKLDTTLEIPVPADAHVVVGAFSTHSLPGALRSSPGGGVPRALTNPIFIDADGDGLWTAPGGKACSYTRGPPG